MCFFAESEPAQVFANVEEGYEDWDRYKGRAARTPRTPASAGLSSSATAYGPSTAAPRTPFLNVALQLSGPDGQIYFGLNDRYAKLVTRDPSTGEFVSRKLMPKPESTEGGRRVSVLKWPEGALLNLG